MPLLAMWPNILIFVICVADPASNAETTDEIVQRRIGRDFERPRRRRQIPVAANLGCVQLTAPLFTSRPFDFGRDAGDRTLSASGVEVGVRHDLAEPLSFFGDTYDAVHILSSGGIGLTSDSRLYGDDMFTNGMTIIAPFWNRNDLSKGGTVWYRETTTEGRALDRARSEIRYQFGIMVTVKSVFIVTWERMQPTGNTLLPQQNTNTFQAAVIVSDDGTYANFIYSRLGWSQGAQAGFSGGNGSHHYALPTSGTRNITRYLEENGNTGIAGEWLFEIGRETVVGCRPGVRTCVEVAPPTTPISSTVASRTTSTDTPPLFIEPELPTAMPNDSKPNLPVQVQPILITAAPSILATINSTAAAKPNKPASGISQSHAANTPEPTTRQQTATEQQAKEFRASVTNPTNTEMTTTAHNITQ